MTATILVAAVVGILFALAVRSIIKQSRNGGCCGSCKSCHSINCKDRNKQENWKQ